MGRFMAGRRIKTEGQIGVVAMKSRPTAVKALKSKEMQNTRRNARVSEIVPLLGRTK